MEDAFEQARDMADKASARRGPFVDSYAGLSLHADEAAAARLRAEEARQEMDRRIAEMLANAKASGSEEARAKAVKMVLEFAGQVDAALRIQRAARAFLRLRRLRREEDEERQREEAATAALRARIREGLRSINAERLSRDDRERLAQLNEMAILSHYDRLEVARILGQFVPQTFIAQ